MFYAERATAPTRAFSPRQLPTNHVSAVPTRAYQIDLSSRQFLPAIGPAVLKANRPVSPRAGRYRPVPKPCQLSKP